jgi:hypothetical protein
MCVCMYLYACMYTYIHTYTYIYTEVTSVCMYVCEIYREISPLAKGSAGLEVDGRVGCGGAR